METPMEIQHPKPEWLAISHALSDMRDSLTCMSLVLSDKLSEMQSPERDLVVNEVEKLLAHICDPERRSHE
jgi:hypothetical protein